MNATLRVAICEDNDADRQSASDAIQHSGFPVELSVFSTGADILAAFHKGRYHIVFLDIYLPNGNGVDIARAMRALDDQVTLVFFTSSSDFALEGYRLGALKYIEKPLVPVDIKAALELAWRLRQSRETCVLATRQGSREVALRDIHYVEVSNHTCVLHLERELVATKLNIDQVALMLSTPRFVRCHRSFIVNFEHVREVGRDFVMTSGDRVYIRGKDERKMADLFARYLAAETRELTDER